MIQIGGNWRELRGNAEANLHYWSRHPHSCLPLFGCPVLTHSFIRTHPLTRQHLHVFIRALVHSRICTQIHSYIIFPTHSFSHYHSHPLVRTNTLTHSHSHSLIKTAYVHCPTTITSSHFGMCTHTHTHTPSLLPSVIIRRLPV